VRRKRHLLETEHTETLVTQVQRQLSAVLSRYIDIAIPSVCLSVTLTLVLYRNGVIYHHSFFSGAVVQLVEYRTRNREVAGSTHTRSTARNLEQVANLLCAQANSASYPQRDGK